MGNATLEVIVKLAKENTDLKAENKKLREALIKYGWHTDRCMKARLLPRCICGYEEAREDKQ